MLICLLVWSVWSCYRLWISILRVRSKSNKAISNYSTRACTHDFNHTMTNTSSNPLTHKCSLAVTLGNTDKSTTFNTLHEHCIIIKLKVSTALTTKSSSSLASKHCGSRTFDDDATTALNDGRTSAPKKAWLIC